MDKKTCKLSELKKGQIAKVISLNNENKELRRRLLDMGITKGVLVEIKKIAPLGDPVDIYLRGYELCLRKKDMESIEVEVVVK
jgi:ferrous iron transport protein A